MVVQYSQKFTIDRIHIGPDGSDLRNHMFNLLVAFGLTHLPLIIATFLLIYLSYLDKRSSGGPWIQQ